jgi:hypothetical protein
MRGNRGKTSAVSIQAGGLRISVTREDSSAASSKEEIAAEADHQLAMVKKIMALTEEDVQLPEPERIAELKPELIEVIDSAQKLNQEIGQMRSSTLGVTAFSQPLSRQQAHLVCDILADKEPSVEKSWRMWSIGQEEALAAIDSDKKTELQNSIGRLIEAAQSIKEKKDRTPDHKRLEREGKPSGYWAY